MQQHVVLDTGQGMVILRRKQKDEKEEEEKDEEEMKCGEMRDLFALDFFLCVLLYVFSFIFFDCFKHDSTREREINCVAYDF